MLRTKVVNLTSDSMLPICDRNYFRCHFGKYASKENINTVVK
ncbi:hypothetical protein [Nostoc sp. ChiSLP03a]|nr:hypothetical protein [Nostoc sp. ChiSLP03a]MDZ8210518.1 hypothetical protein [Nostoc sp. ChiSLP03a]